MANQIPAHLLHSMAIDFDSVFIVKNDGVKNVFMKLETAGLKKFLGLSSQEIYVKEFQELYATGYVTQEGKIVSTVNGQLLIIDEDFFCNLFQLPADGLTNLSEVKVFNIEEMQTTLSAVGQKIKVSDPKKELKPEVQLLADIVAKGLLEKA